MIRFKRIKIIEEDKGHERKVKEFKALVSFYFFNIINTDSINLIIVLCSL